MTLNSFNFTSFNHFVSLERHSFFRKSIYLLILDKDFIIGLKLNTQLVISDVPAFFKKQGVCLDREENPYAYIDEYLINKIKDKYLYDASIFSISKYNFRIPLFNISAVGYSPFTVKNKRSSNFINSGMLKIRTTQGDYNLLNNKPINRNFTGRGSLQTGYNKSINIGYKELTILGKQQDSFLHYLSAFDLLQMNNSSKKNFNELK